jgi:chorismate dehydratase
VSLRIAAIDFLNPAPLMWDFHHAPLNTLLASRYTITQTKPSECARQLLSGEADLGLIPIASLTPDMRIIPSCTIASLDRVRSIQLIIKSPRTLRNLRSLSADTASRSSVIYAQLILKTFYSNSPTVSPASADPIAMLQQHDAALIIGDPALVALERRAEIEAAVGPCEWHDIANLWTTHTRLPWVAAVWAIPASLKLTYQERAQISLDLNTSRRHGCELANIETLVDEWAPRIAIPPDVIRTYLTENIHYLLDSSCRKAILHFRSLAAANTLLPPLDPLPFLEV